MKRRTIARVIILNALFQIELGGVGSVEAEENALYSIDDEVLASLYPELKDKRDKLLEEKLKIQGYLEEEGFRDFIKESISGVLKHGLDFDKKVEARLKNWDYSRIGKVEKNILKTALYEMFYRDDIPASVSIDQAVVLAGIFSTPDAGKFVNGILGTIYEEEIKNGGKEKT